MVPWPDRHFPVELTVGKASGIPDRRIARGRHRTGPMGSVTSDIQDPGKSPGDRQLIRAGRLFTGGGAAPLADRMIEITDGVVTGIARAGEAGGEVGRR